MLFAISVTSRLLFRNLGAVFKQPLSPLHTTAKAMAQEYKIVGLSSLDLKTGEKREVEVEGIEEGKVLLANVGGKTHALSSKCTHYGKISWKMNKVIASFLDDLLSTLTRCPTQVRSAYSRWKIDLRLARRLDPKISTMNRRY